MNYDLPKSVEVGGVDYEIRSDYRAILDILGALSDPELQDRERTLVVLDVFYPQFYDEMPPEHYEEAINQMFWFINGGEADNGPPAPKLVDWEMDFPRIIAPINRVLGTDARGLDYLHWWSFLGYYSEIGDCLFAQIVGIRSKLKSGKPLDKQEREFYRKNRSIIDFRSTYTERDEEELKKWI